ncbi:MAG: 4Fe-4S binding protein [Clostridia bacterium]|nr:4Fe-4S binding protein [Clostridia bacterium]
MKRQKIRKALTIISFLLFPITIYYFSPYLIILGAFEGIVTGSFIVFAAMFLGALVFGRLFCGWICPVGGLQECCTLASDKKAKGGKLDWIKYFIWAPWMITIIAALISAGGIHKIDFLYQTQYGISVSAPPAYIIYYGVVGLIVFLALKTGKRSFCHYVCWMAPFMMLGSKIKNSIKYPSVHLKSDKAKCTSCKLCSKKCPMSLEVSSMVQENKMNNSECILCGECIDTCARGAIKYGFRVHGK